MVTWYGDARLFCRKVKKWRNTYLYLPSSKAPSMYICLCLRHLWCRAPRVAHFAPARAACRTFLLPRTLPVLPACYTLRLPSRTLPAIAHRDHATAPHTAAALFMPHALCAYHRSYTCYTCTAHYTRTRTHARNRHYRTPAVYYTPHRAFFTRTARVLGSDLDRPIGTLDGVVGQPCYRPHRAPQ